VFWNKDKDKEKVKKEDNVIPFKPKLVKLPKPTDNFKEDIKQDPPVYQIGKTEDGRTSFVIGNPYYNATLYLTDYGVRSLIRLLEASIDPNEDDE